MSELDVLERDDQQLIEEHRGELETAEADGYRHVREPLVYRLDAQSYFADLVASSRGDRRAAERLQRHERQMADLPKRELRSLPEREGAIYEYRVNPNLETGHGSEFTVPLWLNQLFAVARRPGEIIAKLVREQGQEFDLPPGCSSISLPRITQGTQVTGQFPGGAVADQDVETATVKAQTVDYVGASDWSLQALEQSPGYAHLDWAIFKDLTLGLFTGLEEQLISGTGENNAQPLGFQNITGINSITWTQAKPVGTELVTKLAEALAQAGTKRKRPPEAILMNSGRWFWLTLSEDTVNRPLGFTDYPLTEWPIAGLAGIGVYLDDAIANTYSSNKEQDAIFVCRPSDFTFWHSPIRSLVDEDVLSGTMQVRFLLYRMSAVMMHRFPAGISKIEGTGLKVQTGFS